MGADVSLAGVDGALGDGVSMVVDVAVTAASLSRLQEPHAVRAAATVDDAAGSGR